jgi:hypothetical protein
MMNFSLTYGLPSLLAIIAGAVAGGVTAFKLRRDVPSIELVDAEPEDDQFIDAEIDLAAVHWQEANNHPPEAAGLMAERLRTLRNIGKRKGWTE